MITSTQTHAAAERFGLPKAVEMIAKAGFDAIDMSMFDDPFNDWLYESGFEPKLLEAKKIARETGVFFNQAHSPFPTMRADDDEYNKIIRPRTLRSFEAAGILGVKTIVVHPVYFPENQKERNLAMYNELGEYAKRCGVKIALENMWGRDSRRNVIAPNVCSTPRELAEYYDALDPSVFTVCLDLGHVGLVGEYEGKFIRELGGKRLTCLHVHDNDYVHDSHRAPFTMNLPWDEICKALADIDYQGELTLEADETLFRLPDEMFKAGLDFMYAGASYLAGRIEKYKEMH